MLSQPPEEVENVTAVRRQSDRIVVGVVIPDPARSAGLNPSQQGETPEAQTGKALRVARLGALPTGIPAEDMGLCVLMLLARISSATSRTSWMARVASRKATPSSFSVVGMIAATSGRPYASSSTGEEGATGSRKKSKEEEEAGTEEEEGRQSESSRRPPSATVVVGTKGVDRQEADDHLPATSSAITTEEVDVR